MNKVIFLSVNEENESEIFDLEMNKISDILDMFDGEKLDIENIKQEVTNFVNNFLDEDEDEIVEKSNEFLEKVKLLKDKEKDMILINWRVDFFRDCIGVIYME